MPKKLFFIFFLILIVFSTVFTPISVSAYEVTGFDITAKAGMLISTDTEKILFEKNIDQKVYPASITKIMTAVVILESGKFEPDAKIAMSEFALKEILGTGSVVSNLKLGEEITQLDLMNYIVMSSAGDCVYLAAEYYAGGVEQFVALMNKKAQELGLTGTHYQNPIGLHDDNNYTTVRDIYTLTKYALKYETFKTICESSKYHMPPTNMSGKRTLSTTNFLQDTTTNYYYQYAKGVKTGFTDQAGRCLVSTASYNGYNYICILMGCPANKGRRFEFIESANLYRWAFNNFSFKEVANSNEPVCEMPLELSLETDFVPLYFKEPFVTILPNEANDSTFVIKPKLISESIEAPIKKGQVLGTAEISYAEEVIGTVELVAGNNISASNILIVAKYIKGFFTSVYMKIFVAIVVIAIVIFILMCISLNINKFKKRRVKYKPLKKKEKNNENFN